MAKVGKPQRRARKGGADRWRVSWVDTTGKRRRRTFATSEQARAFKHAAEEAKTRRVDLGASGTATWEDLVEAYRSAKGSLPTWKQYRGDIRNHLAPVFGGLRLVEIGSAQIEALDRSLLAAEYSEATRVQVLGMLGRMLKLGAARKPRPLIDADRIPTITLPRIAEPEAWTYLQTDEEIDRLLQAAKDHKYGELLHPLYAVLVYTGIRSGEARALTLADVDLPRRTIKVARAGVKATTKGKRIRHVPILAPLLPILSAHVAARVESGAQPSDFLFQSATGGQLKRTAGAFANCSKGSKAWRARRAGRATPAQDVEGAYFLQVRRAAGLPEDLTPHDLRHTFATHCAMAGRDRYWYQKVLGHRSENTTERYTHLDPTKHGGQVHPCCMFADAPALAPAPAAPTSTKVAGLLGWVESFRTVTGREPTEAEIIARLLGVA